MFCNNVEEKQTVSIHALLAECDVLADDTANDFTEFQSTHSLRSATTFAQGIMEMPRVSIHALLAECDNFYLHEDYV